ncbi:hypothetical protein JXL21_08170 [Candidatus Bathyarchaeota archaeon]|nr:hypothetical protein [Candidatus Bathyarchaeota archaeon]
MVNPVAILTDNYQIVLLLPIITAFYAERHFVGRVSIMTNTVSMFVSVAPSWIKTANWLSYKGISFFQVYLLIGLLVGVVSFASYLMEVEKELKVFFNTWIVYNSLIAVIVCLLAVVYL